MVLISGYRIESKSSRVPEIFGKFQKVLTVFHTLDCSIEVTKYCFNCMSIILTQPLDIFIQQIFCACQKSMGTQSWSIMSMFFVNSLLRTGEDSMPACQPTTKSAAAAVASRLRSSSCASCHSLHNLWQPHSMTAF